MILRCTTATGDFDASLEVARIENGGPDGAVMILSSGMEVRLDSSVGEIVSFFPGAVEVPALVGVGG